MGTANSAAAGDGSSLLARIKGDLKASMLSKNKERTQV